MKVGAKILNKMLPNQIQQYRERIYHDQEEFIFRMQGWFNIQKSSVFILSNNPSKKLMRKINYLNRHRKVNNLAKFNNHS